MYTQSYEGKKKVPKERGHYHTKHREKCICMCVYMYVCVICMYTNRIKENTNYQTSAAIITQGIASTR